MSASTDKVRPRRSRSGLSALGSGGRSFEVGSHLCFMYLKKRGKKENNLCSTNVSKWYQCEQVISVCVHECVGLVGMQQCQLAEEWLSARPR